MRKQLTVYSPKIPKFLLPEKTSQAKAQKSFFITALKNGLSPALVLPRANLVRFSMTLNDEEQKFLEKGRRILSEYNLDYGDGRLVGAFVYSYIQAKRKEIGNKTPSGRKKKFVSSGGQFRPDQEKFYQQIIEQFKEGKIIIAEGGTGLGKSRVLARLALEKVDNGVTPVGIIAPTIAVMRHLVNEWLQVKGTAGVHLAMVMGRGQFVDPIRIESFLATPEVNRFIPDDQLENIYQWLDNDCPVLQETGSDQLEFACSKIAYLYSDLLHIAPAVEVLGGKNVQLQQSTESPAYNIYKGLLEEARQAQVVIASHAMLAWDMNMRFSQQFGEILPAFKSLLVDEAHSLETVVASMAAQEVSIIELATAIKKISLGSKLNRKKASRLCGKLIATASTMERTDIFVRAIQLKENSLDTRTAELFSLLDQLKNILVKFYRKGQFIKAKPKNDDEVLIKNSLSILFKIAKKKRSVQVSISPVGGYPTFAIGLSSTKHLFVPLWERTNKGVVLTSATMTIPDKLGQPQSDHIRKLLNLPEERIVIPPPVIPNWIYEPVRVRIPSERKWNKFRPPSMSAQEVSRGLGGKEYENWLKAVLHQIETITEQAKGGTLVLLTSYALVDSFGKFLSTTMRDRLLIQDANNPFAALNRKFHEMSLRGQKPVWLALGAAWVGVDISGQRFGVPPEEDNILTDLVIPRIPFGLNSTITSKIRNMPVKNAEGKIVYIPRGNRNDAAFLFKQGLGRLVRRRDVPSKNLWVLDTRIWLGGQGFYGVFGSILDWYIHMEKF